MVSNHCVCAVVVVGQIAFEATRIEGLAAGLPQPAQPQHTAMLLDPLFERNELTDHGARQPIDFVHLEYQAIDEVP